MTRIQVSGLISDDEVKFVKFSNGDQETIISLASITRSPNEMRSMLGQGGLTVLSPKKIAKIQEQIEDITKWRKVLIAHHVGWNPGGLFALPDGEVFAPPDQLKFEIAQLDDREKCPVRGSANSWRKRVALLLDQQSLPIFALCFSLAPPLLALTSRELNLGFEIVGNAGTGKTTVQQLAASVWGSPTRSQGVPYMVTMDTTINGLEETMAAHAFLPLVMDEANLFAMESSDKEKSKIFKAVTFKMASGSEKARYGDGAARSSHRLGFLISANEPLSTLLNCESESARAAKDRILTIPISADRRHGIFDQIPEKYGSAGEFATTLVTNAERYHGAAGREFIERLVAERSMDEGGLRKEIAGYVHEFRERVEADMGVGSIVRISEAFGLVYAAGELAKRFRVLPKKFDCLKAVATCYLLNRMHDVAPQSLPERLVELGADERTVLWSEKKPKRVAKAEVLLFEEEGRREIWIRPKAISKVFPDWHAILGGSELDDVLVPEAQRNQNKRRAGPSLQSVRMYVFRLGLKE